LVANYATLKRPVGASHGTLPERVAAAIKGAIRAGRMRPGERLVEGRLALDLGVSRIPVREAIRRLAAEGLVTIAPRRGAVIAGLTEREVREIIEVRAMLEGQNARLAARRQDAAVMKRIRALLQRGDAAARGGDAELAALNRRYHEETAAAARNEVLRDIVERLRERSGILFAPEEPARQEALWADHAAILRAILDGDEDRAAALAAAHVIRAFPGMSEPDETPGAG
jgi:DNA-binding GntR family transcriptional regulator